MVLNKWKIIENLTNSFYVSPVLIDRIVIIAAIFLYSPSLGCDELPPSTLRESEGERETLHSLPCHNKRDRVSIE